MTARGRLLDTYAAAIQHDLVDLPPSAHVLGVVRRPTPWLLAVVDANETALGPPPELLEAIKSRHRELQASGLDDATAHNRAMDEVDYGRRYRAHLEGDPEATDALERVRDILADGRDVVLVCFENTAEKRCHRTILREYL
ncbi:MAG: DUF488 domain-containing protein [Halobacteriota archaeon]